MDQQDGQISFVVPGQVMSERYWIVLDAFRQSRGLPPWRKSPPGSLLRAAEVNEAVAWWNQWQNAGGAPRDNVPATPDAPTED